MFEPGDRPGFLAALVSLTVLARALAVALPPILAGLAAQYWLGPLPRQVATSAALMSALFVVVLIALRVLGKCWPTLVSFESGKPQLSDRAAWIYLGLAIPLTFLMSWSSNGIMQSLNALWWFYPVWDQMAARRPWQTEMARAIQNLRSAQYQMKWARMELQRCQDLVAEGAPAPLQEARDVIERLTRQQDEALATLHGLGYRASLSNPDPEPRTRTLHRT